MLMDMMNGGGNKIIFTGYSGITGREGGRDFINFCREASIQHNLKMKNTERTAVSAAEQQRLRELGSKKTELAFSRLEMNGHCIENTGREELKAGMVRDAVSDPGNSIILTSTNSMKTELNGKVHEELIRSGKIEGQVKVLTVNENVFGGDILKRKNACFYEKGYRVRADTDLIGMKKGETGIVTSIDLKNNSINLVKEGGNLEIKLDQGYKNIAVEDSREKSFGKGERIVFLITDNATGVKKGDRGIIKEIDEAKMTVCLDMNKTAVISFRDYKSFDYAYASTAIDDYTQRNNKIIADCSDFAFHAGDICHITLRSVQNVKIYTEDKSMLKEKIKEMEYNSLLSDCRNNRERTFSSLKSLEMEVGNATRKEQGRGYEREGRYMGMEM
jgi:hypothetical protein